MVSHYNDFFKITEQKNTEFRHPGQSVKERFFLLARFFVSLAANRITPERLSQYDR